MVRLCLTAVSNFLHLFNASIFSLYFAPGSGSSHSDTLHKLDEGGAGNVSESSSNVPASSAGSSAVLGGAWGGESKLSDVVKGVAKPKTGGNHYHGNNNTNSSSHGKPLLNGPAPAAPSAPTTTASNPVASKASQENSAAATVVVAVASTSSPSLPNGDLAQSTLALTPPTSPGKREGKPFPPSGSSASSSSSAHPVTSKSTKAAAAAAPATPSASSSPPLPGAGAEPAKGATTAAGTASATPATPSTASVTAPSPCVSYAKMAEQNKDRLEQMAREAKERELELERERRRVASQNSECPFFLKIVSNLILNSPAFLFSFRIGS